MADREWVFVGDTAVLEYPHKSYVRRDKAGNVVKATGPGDTWAAAMARLAPAKATTTSKASKAKKGDD